MNIIRYRKIFYTISGLLIGLSILSLIFWGLKLGIDFTGGSLLEVEFLTESRPDNNSIKESLASLDLGEIVVQPIGQKGIILRFKDIDEATHRNVVQRLNELAQSQIKEKEETSSKNWIEEKRFESIGPVIGQELKKKAQWAIFLVLLMIILYIAWAFREVSKPVSSFYYGLAAILALFHDIVIPVGIFAVLGHFYNLEVGLLFVTGLLTILAFSVHDTVVVFDRTRENLRKGFFDDFETTVNESIKQVVSRSISTSLAVLLTVLAIYFFGGETIRYFALLLILGVFFGTYSSIFLASPLLVSWQKYRNRNR